MATGLDHFYNSILHFLVINSLEEKPAGHTEEEISACEAMYAVNLPKAYRLFLSRMAKSDLHIFDHQDYSLSGIVRAQKVSGELLEDGNYKLESSHFVFSQWQGYNFYYLDLNTANSNVSLYIEGGDSQPEIYAEGVFTDWLCRRIEISLNLRKQLNGLEISHLLIELEQIRKMVNPA